METLRGMMRRKLRDAAQARKPVVEVPTLFEKRAHFAKLDWLSGKGAAALAYCQRFAADPMNHKAPLLLSKSGTGKTHILFATVRAICSRVCEEIDTVCAQEESAADSSIERWNGHENFGEIFPICSIAFTEGAEIAHDIRQSAKSKREDALDRVVARYRQEDAVEKKGTAILFIDDIEVMKMGDWLNEELYRIFNYRYKYGLPTPMATNLSMKALSAHLGERITRRIGDMTQPFSIE